MQWWQKAGLCLFQEFLQNVALSFWDLPVQILVADRFRNAYVSTEALARYELVFELSCHIYRCSS